MDSFQRHGGLLIDEIKLSESLSLASNGTIEGFVDLGKFTPESRSAGRACDRVAHNPGLARSPLASQCTQRPGGKDSSVLSRQHLKNLQAVFCKGFKAPQVEGLQQPTLHGAAVSGPRHLFPVPGYWLKVVPTSLHLGLQADSH
ncbi:hypothetical protein V5799_011630 [Amblyomma americanum]|uniref:Uncharacterized protein n=1 Tax=Amblyomma americanum TaxID=6943 RepID=A0AAQ4EGC1_AMBAM